MPGTVGDLVASYFASAAVRGLPPETTRATYRGIIEGFRKDHDDKRLAHLRPEDVEHLFTGKKDTAGRGEQLAAHGADEIRGQQKDDYRRFDRGDQDVQIPGERLPQLE